MRPSHVPFRFRFRSRFLSSTHQRFLFSTKARTQSCEHFSDLKLLISLILGSGIMADTPTPSSEPSTPPSSAAEQARIRKERREAKIRAGGSARLNKITGLGGGVQRGINPCNYLPRRSANHYPRSSTSTNSLLSRRPRRGGYFTTLLRTKLQPRPPPHQCLARLKFPNER